MASEIDNIAKLMVDVWGNPKADAEARQYQQNREINQLKLEQARREADRDRELDPFRQSWRELFSGGGQVPDTEYDPYHGENQGQWPVDTVAQGKPVMSWNKDRGLFEFDQSRVGDIMSNGVALYGPDFATKWHEFLTNAAPTNKHLTDSEANLASRKGLEAVSGGITPSDQSKKNVDDSIRRQIMSNAMGNAEAAAQVGALDDPLNPGAKLVGPNHPSKLMTKPSSEPPPASPDKSANVVANMISANAAAPGTSSEPPTPSSTPGASFNFTPVSLPGPQPGMSSVSSAATTETPATTTSPASQPDDEPSDPLKDQSVASLFTKAIKSQMETLNKANKAQFEAAAKRPTGKLEQLPGGGTRWVPDPITPPEPVIPDKRSLAPDEIEKLFRMENPSVPRNYKESVEKMNSDRAWTEGLSQVFIDQLSPSKDTPLSKEHALRLALEANDVRLKLEQRGFAPDFARTVAVSAVRQAFEGNYELIYQIVGDAHVVDKREKRSITHWDKDNLTPAEMISGAEAIGGTVNKATGALEGAQRPSSVGMFKNSIEAALGQFPMEGDSKYKTQGLDLIKTFRDYGTTAPPQDVVKLAADIKFWEDIVANSKNGYAARGINGGYTQRQVSPEQVELIRQKIEAAKARLKQKTQSN